MFNQVFIPFETDVAGDIAAISYKFQIQHVKIKFKKRKLGGLKFDTIILLPYN